MRPRLRCWWSGGGGGETMGWKAGAKMVGVVEVGWGRECDVS